MKIVNRKILIILTVILGIALVAFRSLPDAFTFKFSESEINTHYQNLSNIKTIVERSNLPHQEVIFVQKSIDSLQGELVRQIKLQLPPAKK
jgi:glycopeptide antibiotics resistance protein